MSALGHLFAARNARISHEMLLKGFMGTLALALESKDPIGSAARNTMVRQAAAAGTHFVSQFDFDMQTAVSAVLAMALHDSGAYASDKMTQERMDDMRDYAKSVQVELSASMQTIVNGNVASLMNELRQIRLAASMLQVSRGMTSFGAVLKARMGRLEALKFTTMDSAGRKWRSGDYLSAMVSKALLQLYVESFIYCAAVLGDTTAKVIYADPDHEGHGRVFAIVGDGPDSFETIKDVIWHPNSTAGVQRVHS